MSLSRVLLFGAGGCGKTVATATALKHPKIKRLIYLQTDRNSAPGVTEGLKIHNIKPEAGQIISCFPKPKEAAFSNLHRALKNFQTESKQAALKGNASSTQNKEKYGFFMNVIDNLMSFEGEDYVTKEQVKLGNVGQLGGESDVFIIDGLSVLSQELWSYIHGDKIMTSMNDYGPVQQLLANFLKELTLNVNAHVILLAHEKEKHETTTVDGKESSRFVRYEFNTLCGHSNYETLSGNFTDIIRATKMGIKFIWETNKPTTHAIARNLPAQAMLEPDFSKYNFFN